VLLRIGAKPQSAFQCAPPHWSETTFRISVCSSALERNQTLCFSVLLRSRMRPNTQQLRIGACCSVLECAQDSIKLCIGASHSALELFQCGIQRASQASTMINFLPHERKVMAAIVGVRNQNLNGTAQRECLSTIAHEWRPIVASSAALLFRAHALDMVKLIKRNMGISSCGRAHIVWEMQSIFFIHINFLKLLCCEHDTDWRENINDVTNNIACSKNSPMYKDIQLRITRHCAGQNKSKQKKFFKQPFAFALVACLSDTKLAKLLKHLLQCLETGDKEIWLFFILDDFWVYQISFQTNIIGCSS